MLHIATPNIFIGGLLVGQNKHDEAIAHYVEAEKAALSAHELGDLQGQKIQLQSRMMQGAALVAQGAFDSAATLFQETVPLAEIVKDALAQLDCWRLCCYCREQLKTYEIAWSNGNAGIDIAKSMDNKTRQQSTLAYLAEGMMRIAQQNTWHERSAMLEQEMTILLGPQCNS